MLLKLAYEYGALDAVKSAGIGRAVPVGYRWEPNQDWVQSLSPELVPRANEGAAKLTELLQAHQGLGSGYAQNPEIAQVIARLGRMKRQSLSVPPIAETG